MENVVADHLSSLGLEVTPSEELPTDDSFPDDQLFAISHQATSWYTDLVNFKVCGVLPPDFLIDKGKNSFPMPNIMCGKNRFSTSCVQIEYIEAVCRKMKFIVSYTIIMLRLMVSTLARTKLL